MLLTNQRLDKLLASRVDFQARGMLSGSCLAPNALPTRGTMLPDEVRNVVLSQNDRNDHQASTNDPFADIHDQGPTEGPKVLSSVSLARCHVRKIPKTFQRLATLYHLPSLPILSSRFVYEQLHPNTEDISLVPLAELPSLSDCRVRVFPSAVATFFAPSDPCGIGGMHHERIRATPLWRNEYPRYDCVFVMTGLESGIHGMHVARVRLFFSFIYQRSTYPCAFVDWFISSDTQPDPETGMWIVEPEVDDNGHNMNSVIHVDTILRSAHLIPVYGNITLPAGFHFSDSLDAFSEYYINRYADHRTFE
ncbi:hypothetical protein QCA50_012551 [Cerrena zonata]|uniref:Uncharacterized protein n=1 Tax=Cerrena zonata TaxID=2478898 RepID=A0AAW0FY40_9APHY